MVSICVSYHLLSESSCLAASQAFGLESIPLPIFQDGPGPASQAAEAIKSKAEAAADTFEKSDFLKGLREKSDLNRDKYASPPFHDSLL